MMPNPYLSLIIPAYNEGERINKILKRILEHLGPQDYSWELLVMLDGSEDNTFEVVSSYKDSFKGKLKIIYNKANHGKGFVVRQGMLEAKGDYKIFTDADNSTDIKYLEPMLAKFKKGYDIVISTRDPKDAKGAGQEIPQVWYKRQMGNASNLLVQIFAVPGIWDTQNGFKGFSAKAAEDIFSRATIDRWGFDFEALAIARKLKYKIGIIPIIWKNDPKSHVKLSHYLNTFKELLTVRLNLWSGKYK